MRNVKDTIVSMLTENTGRAMGDSGDAYGRNYERNQGIKFELQPEVEVDTIYGDNTTTEDITYTISLFHYLNKYMEFDALTEKVNDALDTARSNSEEDVSWSQYAMEFVETNMDFDITEQSDTFNTYNYDSNLSQGLQFNMFEVEDSYYALIQIHGGCDIRGGYTDAVCFKVPDEYGCLAMPMEDVYGSIDDYMVSNSYDGYYLYGDDDAEQEELYEKYVPITKDSKVVLYLREM